MKNIFEIMKEYGLEVPEDKKKDFEKAVLDNYKTVSDYETQSEKLKNAEGKVTTLTESLAPFDQHTLIESGNINTKIGSGKLSYRTPYARRLYYHPEYEFSTEHNPQAGGYWFERMKQQYKERILAGAKKIAGGKS